ncbi:MAG: TlpA disulfide reductase family protein [Bacteroidota bacterium]
MCGKSTNKPFLRFYATFEMTLFLLSFTLAQEHQNLVVQSIQGDEVSLELLIANGPVLVNFWALWCEPCKVEMKQFQTIYDRYKEKGFSILAINQDNQKSVAKVSTYISSNDYSFLVSTDPKGEISQQFNVQSYPTSLLFDKNGIIVYKSIGYKQGDEKKIVDALEKIFAVKNEE